MRAAMFASTEPTLIPNREFARRRGVSMRTIFNWEKSGVLSPPTKINGRKFRRSDEMRKFDEAGH